jgi:hypothetical protein
MVYFHTKSIFQASLLLRITCSTFYIIGETFFEKESLSTDGNQFNQDQENG